MTRYVLIDNAYVCMHIPIDAKVRGFENVGKVQAKHGFYENETKLYIYIYIYIYKKKHCKFSWLETYNRSSAY